MRPLAGILEIGDAGGVAIQERGVMTDADLLAEVWLFRETSRESLEQLVAFAFNKSYAPGEVVFEEGQTGNGLYMITTGKVEVVRGLGSANERQLAVLEAGEVFGEMALLDELPRSASVRALEDTHCLGIDRFLFVTQLYKDPQVAITMIQVLAQRLREMDERFLAQRTAPGISRPAVGSRAQRGLRRPSPAR
jgi:CRP-like cAMP-binding protein